MSEAYTLAELIPVIRLNELHLQLQQDPFYGYRRVADHQPDAAAVETNTHRILAHEYGLLEHIAQVRQYRDEFHRQFFKSDAHRELITLWCSFCGLPVYRQGERVDWRWRDFATQWDAEIAVEDAELREFLRGREFPLPVYFFYDDDEPDNTGSAEICRQVAASLALGPGASSAEIKRTARALRDQAWQNRLDQLAAMPEHQDKTHASLCAIVASELIGEGANASTIMRQTRAPAKKIVS